MTDIPQKYIDEAIRRMNEERETRGFPPGYYDHTAITIVTLARTLKELNWEPPVDLLLLRAREIVANTHQELGWMSSANSVRQGRNDHHIAVKAVLTALKENSNA